MGRDVYYSHVGRHQGQGLEEPSSCYGSCPGKGTAGLSFSYPIRSVENGLLLSFSTSSVCPSPHSPCSRPAAADWSHLSRPMHLPSRSPSQPPSSFDPGGGGSLLPSGVCLVCSLPHSGSLVCGYRCWMLSSLEGTTVNGTGYFPAFRDGRPPGAPARIPCK